MECSRGRSCVTGPAYMIGQIPGRRKEICPSYTKYDDARRTARRALVS